MEGYRQRLLNSPSSEKVIKKVFDVALDDDHSHRYRAADLNRAFENVRTRLIQQTRGYMTARDDYDANE